MSLEQMTNEELIEALVKEAGIKEREDYCAKYEDYGVERSLHEAARAEAQIELLSAELLRRLT